MNLRVLGIVPARGGSKRLASKNLRLLGGKPLVAWAIEAARAARRVERLIVSSDDSHVLEIAANYDPTLPLRRPDELCTDTSPAMDYVRHALAILQESDQRRFDAVAIVQPSSPFTTAADIDATIELLENSGANSAVSVMEVSQDLHPLKFKTMQGDRLLPYFEAEAGRMAAHELPRVFVRNCSVYATRRTMIDAGQIIGDDCRGYVMPRERSLDINDQLDLAFAEFIWSRRHTSRLD